MGILCCYFGLFLYNFYKIQWIKLVIKAKCLLFCVGSLKEEFLAVLMEILGNVLCLKKNKSVSNKECCLALSKVYYNNKI